jgi:hypothetical protein
MAKRQNPKGRSINEPKHIRLYEWELSCPAYRALHPYARSLLVEFLRRFNGSNNGEIHLSILEAKKALGQGRKAAERGLAELQKYGWVKITKKGLFTVRESERDATEWAVTREPVGNGSATKDYMKWTQDMIQQKQRAVLPRDTLRAPRGHGHQSGKGQKRIDRAPRGHGKAPIGIIDRAPRGHTYNLPGNAARPAHATPTQEQARHERRASEMRLHEVHAQGESIKARFYSAVFICTLLQRRPSRMATTPSGFSRIPYARPRQRVF